jgi:hypothetical protein
MCMFFEYFIYQTLCWPKCIDEKIPKCYTRTDVTETPYRFLIICSNESLSLSLHCNNFEEKGIIIIIIIIGSSV